MKIVIASQKGIGKLVTEELERLDEIHLLNKLSSISRPFHNLPLEEKIKVINPEYSYTIQNKQIDICYNQNYPDFLIASNEDERKNILKKDWYCQTHLNLEGGGIFINRLEKKGSVPRKIYESNILSLYIPEFGRCRPECRQPNEDLKLWKGIVRGMVMYFLDPPCWKENNSYKAIFSAKIDRDILKDIFEELGVVSA